MLETAVMVTVACVLFVHMGLSEAIQETLHFQSRILSCPKCCTMWTSLACFLAKGFPALPSVAAAFLCSYASLWLTLVLDRMAAAYNSAYENITQDTGTAEDAPAPEDDPPEAGASEVPQMQMKHDTTRTDQEVR